VLSSCLFQSCSQTVCIYFSCLVRLTFFTLFYRHCGEQQNLNFVTQFPPVSRYYNTLRFKHNLRPDNFRCIKQGGSNMTGTNCDLFTHNQSRSYLNHLVFHSSFEITYSVYFEYFHFRCQLNAHTVCTTVHSLLLQHVSALTMPLSGSTDQA
jgi:hypothetical protein